MSESASFGQSQKYEPFKSWQGIVEWAQIHRRDRIFRKDEPIPTRPGLLYLVKYGAVRIVGMAQTEENSNSDAQELLPETTEKIFLGFVGAGQPFEIVAKLPFSIQAYAHLEQTEVIWLYWQEIEDWPDLHREVLETFRDRHQRQLLWLCIIGQKRTIDRLIGFLKLLIEEHGQSSDRGDCLPYPLTHAQIASAIGATRVTITRLLGRLRDRGTIAIEEENLICWLTFPK
jgi:CRP-like cAMP-binding protein